MYKLTASPNQVLRSDGALIPDITANYGDALLYQAWRADGGVPEDADIVHPTPPNWDALYYRLLVGDLKPIFDDIKAIAKINIAINTDYTNIIEAFKIRTEQALRDCLDELIVDGYVISPEYKLLWNNAIAELNFSELVKL